jgi:hypothetical protein
VDVLQRNVNITRDLRALGDGLDEFIGPVRGVRVEQANPEITRQVVKFAQESAQRGSARGQIGVGAREF